MTVISGFPEETAGDSAGDSDELSTGEGKTGVSKGESKWIPAGDAEGTDWPGDSGAGEGAAEGSAGKQRERAIHKSRISREQINTKAITRIL